MLQGVQLPSLDKKVFLLPQTDGNLVLYNQSLVGTYGTTQAAAIWYSGVHCAQFIARLTIPACLRLESDSGHGNAGPENADTTFHHGAGTQGASYGPFGLYMQEVCACLLPCLKILFVMQMAVNSQSQVLRI